MNFHLLIEILHLVTGIETVHWPSKMIFNLIFGMKIQIKNVLKQNRIFGKPCGQTGKKANRGQNFFKVWEIVKTAEVAVFDFSEEIWNLALFERRLYVTNDDLMIKTPEQTSNKNFSLNLRLWKCSIAMIFNFFRT